MQDKNPIMKVIKYHVIVYKIVYM